MRAVRVRVKTIQHLNTKKISNVTKNSLFLKRLRTKKELRISKLAAQTSQKSMATFYIFYIVWYIGVWNRFNRHERQLTVVLVENNILRIQFVLKRIVLNAVRLLFENLCFIRRQLCLAVKRYDSVSIKQMNKNKFTSDGIMMILCYAVMKKKMKRVNYRAVSV